MLLAMKAQQQSYSGLRSPGRSSSTYLCTDSECIPTARSVSTLHTVKTVLWPYRPYDCTDSAVVTLSAQKQPEVFIQPISEQLWKGNALPKYRGFFFHFFKIYRCVVLFFPFQYAYFWLYSWVVSMSVSTNGIELINVILFFNVESVVPSIAQLVERRTVEWIKSSLGRWFESGSKELIFLLFPARLTILYLLSEALIDFEKFWFCFFIVIILWCMINYQNVRVGSY